MLPLLAKRAAKRWKWYATVAAPLILAPLLQIGTKEAKCAYGVLLVTLFWMFQVVPLAVTSLLPVVLFPLLGVMTTDAVCRNYMKETNMMLLAGLIAAIAIEDCNLHRRIALRVLMLVGGSVKWLMLGFMGTTAFLSMWISNTATTAMMIPIVESIISELFVDQEKSSGDSPIYTINTPTNNSQEVTVGRSTDALTEVVVGDKQSSTDNSMSPKEARSQRKRMRSCILLSIAYAANLGGTGTITGTGTNLVLMEVLSTNFGNKTGINFATWMVFNIPSLILMLFLAWLWLQISILGPRYLIKKDNKHDMQRIKNLIKKQYIAMGNITFHEIVILSLFIVLILLWAFRSPEFMPGWADLLPNQGIKDSVAGMLIVFLMFVAPSMPDFFCRNFSDHSLDSPPPRALTWPSVEKKVPWSVLLIMGGGFALADASATSGLSQWMGIGLTNLRYLSPLVIVTIVSATTAMVTEVASNTATATILLPVLVDMSRAICVNPLYLMLPATVACSYAFMLPIATPPNALVFETVKMSVFQMIKPGFVMNLLCIGSLILMVNTLGVKMFSLDSYPEWAWTNATNCTISSS